MESELLKSRKRKPYYELKGRANKIQNRKRIEKIFEKIDSLLRDSELCLHGDIHLVKVSEGSFYNLVFKEELTENKTNLLTIKDDCFMSDHAYKILRKNLNLNHIIPSLYNIRLSQKRLNPDTLKNSFGVYIDIKEKIEEIVYLKRNNGLKIENNILKIKLCGDGANISRKNSIFAISFSIIDDRVNCKKASGHFIVGIFNIIETYENLKKALEEIVLQISNLKNIMIGSEEIKLDIKFCNDMKATSLLMGIGAATSMYPCNYCKIKFVPKENSDLKITEFKARLQQEWSLDSLPEKNLANYRTYEESLTKCKEKTPEKRLGIYLNVYLNLYFSFLSIFSFS